MRCSVLLLASLLGACGPWQAPDAPDPRPTPLPSPTPAEAGVWNPPISDALLRNPDHGWVASNPDRPWEAISTRVGGGEPYRVASVIEMTMPLSQWFAPFDGSDPDDAAAGSAAARVQEAIDRRRYVGLGIYADDVSDLPTGWTTTDVPFDPTDPLQTSPDGLISLVDLGDRTAPNYADPDYWQQLLSVIAALGERFGEEPGVAFVHVSGFGDRGSFTFSDPDPWFNDATAPFTAVTYQTFSNAVATTWDQSFPLATAFLSWQSIEHAFDEDIFLDMLLGEDFQLRDGCLGGCDQPEFDRFPGGSGTPFPADDPYGGWLPGDLADSKVLLGAGGLGGIADWRLAEADGTWDSAALGSVDGYMDLVFESSLAHSSLRFATLSDRACHSEWVTAAAPVGSPCGTQSVGDVWAPLLDYGRRMGTRYAVTEVRAPSRDVSGSVWAIEIDITNLGDGRAVVDREIEVGFLDRSDREPLDLVTFEPQPPTSAWTPGQTTTLLVELPTADLYSADPAAYSLYLRMKDERAFGGGIELAHDDRDESGRHVLASWPAE